VTAAEDRLVNVARHGRQRSEELLRARDNLAFDNPRRRTLERAADVYREMADMADPAGSARPRKAAYFTTYEWPPETLADHPDWADQSVGEALRILATHRVTLTYAGPDHEANSFIWRMEGPDLPTAADAMDIDVEDAYPEEDERRVHAWAQTLLAQGYEYPPPGPSPRRDWSFGVGDHVVILDDDRPGASEETGVVADFTEAGGRDPVRVRITLDGSSRIVLADFDHLRHLTKEA
jgi:hypothetical protein